ncbi:MAG: hypothetical protein JO127_11860 [Caulobacteraceae bacterium]|nr:hypothetical protein [Caulobacteraceae bacterium]
MLFEAFLRIGDRGKGAQFRRGLADLFGPRSGAVCLSVAAEDGTLGDVGAAFPASSAVFDAIVSFESEHARSKALDRPELQKGVGVKLASVSSLVQKAGPPASPGLRDGAAMVAFLVPDPALSDEAFQQRWRDHTRVLFEVQRGPSEYIQNLFVSSSAEMSPYRGYARLRYPAIETLAGDMAPAYEGADKDGVEDVARFAIGAEAVMMREYIYV